MRDRGTKFKVSFRRCKNLHRSYVTLRIFKARDCFMQRLKRQTIAFNRVKQWFVIILTVCLMLGADGKIHLDRVRVKISICMETGIAALADPYFVSYRVKQPRALGMLIKISWSNLIALSKWGKHERISSSRCYCQFNSSYCPHYINH